ncbi:MAG: 3-isopropylmalate dehydratase small subunit [Planctomycetota bacterium]|jgi:3-isopropylmalate/(R)-2-methylmalate dehydratase small subunit
MRTRLTTVRSPILVLAATNIDTDQIIPARFLTTTSSSGLGQHAFADWRYAADGTPDKSCVLNDPRASDCRILVAGDNFGCGSSREHAPWALLDMGFRVVISSTIADIFRNNAVKNGLLPIQVPTEVHSLLLANPWAEMEVDLEQCCVRMPDGTKVAFQIDAFARHCLLEGIDELGYLLSKEDSIRSYEEGLSGR